MLMHDQTATYLACDTFENLETGPVMKYMVSSTYNSNPVARSVFKLVRPPKQLKNLEDDIEDDVLRIGSAFCIACNDSLLVSPDSDIMAPPLYLSSVKKNERTATVDSNRQMVYLSRIQTADAIWTVTIPSLGRANASERFLSIGSALYANESIQISHRQTNMLLTCNTKIVEATDFGNELEVFADRSNAFGKVSLIQSEFQGLSTTNTLAKPDAPSFAWHFVTSSSPQAAVDNRCIAPAPSVETLIAALKDRLIAKEGITCFWKLRSFFHRVMSEYNGVMDCEDLKTGFVQMGIRFEEAYIDSIIDSVGTHEGLVNLRDFIRSLRGHCPEQRQVLIEEVFSSLSDGARNMSAKDFFARHQTAYHPLVTHDKKGPKEASDHLRKALVTIRRDGEWVSIEDFREYYYDLSAAVDDDELFKEIIVKSYGL